MFEIEVDWRGGQFVVAQANPKPRTERARPSAPDRTGPSDDVEGDPVALRRALEWLERQPVPVVVASLAPKPTDSSVYVPVREAHVRSERRPALPRAARLEKLKPDAPTTDHLRQTRLSQALARALGRAQRLLVDLPPRHRQQSGEAQPQSRFRLVWSQDPPSDLRPALRALCRRVLSAAPDEPAPPTPSPPPAPKVSAPRRGVPAQRRRDAASNLGQDWTVFAGRTDAPVSATRCAEVSGALRDELLRHAGPPTPIALDERSSCRLAIVPLPLVAHPQPSVPIVGVALVWPRDMDVSARRAVLSGLARWEATSCDHSDAIEHAPAVRLPLPRATSWSLQRVRGMAAKAVLRPMTWCAPSRMWATATPIALDGDLDRLGAEPFPRPQVAELVVAQRCRELGLPTPSAVEVSVASVWPGSVDARLFTPGRGTAAAPKVLVHARIEFLTSVRGPVLLGDGRYRGLGLCRPIPKHKGSTAMKEDRQMFDPWPF